MKRTTLVLAAVLAAGLTTAAQAMDPGPQGGAAAPAGGATTPCMMMKQGMPGMPQGMPMQMKPGGMGEMPCEDCPRRIMGGGAMPMGRCGCMSGMGGMGGMMPPRGKGCLLMAECMSGGPLDLAALQGIIGLSDEQAKKLRAVQKSLLKESIEGGARLRVAELELADLLAEDQADLGKAEARLAEAEKFRTQLRLAHIRSAEELKKILSKEQQERLHDYCRRQPPLGAPDAPVAEEFFRGDAPQSPHEGH